MRIWIDADACPGAIKEIVIKAALKREVLAVFVANKDIWLPPSPQLSAVRVALGPDVVDQHIVSECELGDLAITQDIPLAAQLVPRGLVVISPYGTLFSPANIGDRLATRDFMQDMRDAGLVTGGPKPFGEREKRQFANAFDQALTRLLSGKPR
ncbi:MAG TPA: YaiI/YqxD family protein [Coleofasciculaceae cyanobacterium]|jgi:hypothetical protein